MRTATQTRIRTPTATEYYDAVIGALEAGHVTEADIDERLKGIFRVMIPHNSQEMGHALADVLFGDYNPAGRLNQTWPASLDQLPDMLDYDITNGRTYMYTRDEPLFHFGYGLSYTTFEYNNLAVSETEIRAGEQVTVRVDVTNTGERDGEEVVQLYVSFSNSNVTRPIKALKGFKRVAVAAGETVTVEIPLKASALAYWHIENQRFTLEPGEVELMVGSASNQVRLEETITVVPD